MAKAFFDRQRELRLLDTFFSAPDVGLLVLYGRRRIGKTGLLEHWEETRFTGAKAGQILNWMATTQSAAYQLHDFAQAASKRDPRSGRVATGLQLETWDAAFDYIGDLAELHKADGPFVVILDEFTYLVQSDESIPSLLQRAWDRRLSKIPNLRLILSGSLVGIMEKKVLSAQAPLYGRATQILRLRPLEFGTLPEMFPNWSPAERVAVYGVCGGIPAYLNLFMRARGFSDGLQTYALAPNSILFTDASLLIHERLDESHIYESVISVIASGFHEWAEIAKMARVDDRKLAHYLDVLRDLEFIRRDDPVMSGSTGGRRGRYYVSDPFLRFYFRFIVPNRSTLNRGLVGRTIETISEDLRAFLGTYVFEELCRDWVLMEAESGRLGWRPEEYGAYWRRSKGASVQLDVVAAISRAKRCLIGEAKWTESPINREVITSLVERSKRLLANIADSDDHEDKLGHKTAAYQAEYAYFSRSGFTQAARAEAARIGARLIDLQMIEAAHVELVQMGR